jgi:hypothetical protein
MNHLSDVPYNINAKGLSISRSQKLLSGSCSLHYSTAGVWRSGAVPLKQTTHCTCCITHSRANTNGISSGSSKTPMPSFQGPKRKVD